MASGVVAAGVVEGAVPVSLACDGTGLSLADGVPVGLSLGDGDWLVGDVAGVGVGVDGLGDPDDPPMLLIVVPVLELSEIG